MRDGRFIEGSLDLDWLGWAGVRMALQDFWAVMAFPCMRYGLFPMLLSGWLCHLRDTFTAIMVDVSVFPIASPRRIFGLAS